MFRRVLLISPEPYKDNSSSRCLETFFGGWESDKIAQLFTTATEPYKSFCSNYYRITDSDILKARMHKNKVAGVKVSCKDEIKIPSEKTNDVENQGVVLKVKSLFKHKSPMYHMARMALWGNRWESTELYAWIESFAPEIIFLDLGQDNILANIALKVSDKYNIPVMVFLPDDFYFKKNVYQLLFSRVYTKKIKKKIEEVLKKSVSNIFSCDLMRDKYCAHFGCDGEVLYFTSNIKASMELREKNTFAFLGSFEYGRWKSLILIGNVLQSISESLFLDVYGKTQSDEIKQQFLECSGIKYHDMIPYSDVMHVMKTVDFVVHVEDFSEKNKRFTRYSLSTKIADCLSCGATTFSFGPSDIGSIDYLKKNEVAFICSEPAQLRETLNEAMNDLRQKQCITEKALALSHVNHSGVNNRKKMELLVERAMEKNT